MAVCNKYDVIKSLLTVERGLVGVVPLPVQCHWDAVSGKIPCLSLACFIYIVTTELEALEVGTADGVSFCGTIEAQIIRSGDELVLGEDMVFYDVTNFERCRASVPRILLGMVLFVYWWYTCSSVVW